MVIEEEVRVNVLIFFHGHCTPPSIVLDCVVFRIIYGNRSCRVLCYCLLFLLYSLLNFKEQEEERNNIKE
jgi:hypothetical protein